MRRAVFSSVIVCLFFALSSCSRGRDLEVANPCDHPLFVVTSSRDHASLQDRDLASLAGSWLEWAVIPAQGVALAGGVSDSAGMDFPHSVWVDAAAYRTTVTFDQVAEAEGPILLDAAACAEETPPEALVLVEPSEGLADPALIRVAGRSEVVDEMATQIRSNARLISEVEVANGLMVAKVWPTETGEYGSVLVPLAEMQPPPTLHYCNRYACDSSSIGVDGSPRLPLRWVEPPSSPPNFASGLLGTFVVVGPIVVIIVVWRRRARRLATADVPRSPDLNR